MFSGVAVTLPAMGAELGAGAVALNLVETLFLAGGVGFLLPAGQLADRTDRASVFNAGLIVFGLSSLALAFSQSLALILALRFVQGTAGAFFNATGLALLSTLAPPERRGQVFGWSVASVYLGLALGPLLSGLIVHHLGWRAVFSLAGLALLLTGLVSVWLMPGRWRRPDRLPHGPSSALMLLSVLSLVMGAAGGRAYGALGFGLSVALAFAFVGLQRRLEATEGASPLLQVTALRTNRVLASALVIQTLMYTNANATVFLLSLYVQDILQFEAADAGLLLASGTLVMATLAPVSGWVADRIAPWLVASVGVGFGCLAAGASLSLSLGSSAALIIGLRSLQGLGFAGFSTPNMMEIMGAVPADQASTASALVSKARNLGMILGMVLVAIIIAATLGDQPVRQHPGAFLAAMRWSFGALLALSVVALGLSLARGRLHR